MTSVGPFDITDIVTTLTLSRRQSFDEVMRDMNVYLDPQQMSGFSVGDSATVDWEQLVRPMHELPTIDALQVERSPIMARLFIQLGMEIVAFTCNPVGGDCSFFLGVHCFPNEPMVLDRAAEFVLMRLEGRATVLPADVFERATDPDQPATQENAYVWSVHDIRLEAAPGVSEA